MLNLKFHSGLTKAGRQHFRFCFCQANFEGSSLTTLVIGDHVRQLTVVSVGDGASSHGVATQKLLSPSPDSKPGFALEHDPLSRRNNTMVNDRVCCEQRLGQWEEAGVATDHGK